jgi:hypothetical protein
MISPRMRILLLCNYDPLNAATVCDHINAFAFYTRHEIVVFSELVSHGGNLPPDVNLDWFDAVILHYSVFLAVDSYVSCQTRERLQSYAGIKAIFLQDEYRFVEESVERIRALGFSIIFTCMPEPSIEMVYPTKKLPGVQRINVLTGYVPSALLLYKPFPLARRKYHVSYRGRRYPAWHGRLGLEKWQIAERFKSDAERYALRTNISYREGDRLYGADWTELIRQSRAVLGVESGASVFDFTGQISAKIDSYSALVGEDELDYAKVRAKYFAEVEDAVPIAQISPRIFEAMALRTMCVLYEGEYSGVIEPWRHYVPLKKDHSNMAQVASILNDFGQMAEVISNAYAEVACNKKWAYATFIEKVERALEMQYRQRLQSGSTPATRDGPVDESARPSREVFGGECEQGLLSITEKYRCKLVSNPHGLTQPRYKWLLKLIRAIRPYIPRRIVRVVRNILTA